MIGISILRGWGKKHPSPPAGEPTYAIGKSKSYDMEKIIFFRITVHTNADGDVILEDHASCSLYLCQT
jgi:hypothetical protein